MVTRSKAGVCEAKVTTLLRAPATAAATMSTTTTIAPTTSPSTRCHSSLSLEALALPSTCYRASALQLQLAAI